MDLISALNSTDSTEAFYDVKLSSKTFGETRVMIGLGVSGFSAFAFLIFFFWQCCVGRKDEKNKKMISKALPGAIWLMVLYTGLEFATAVLLVIGKLRVIQYYPTLIALDFLSIFADSLLLAFLLIHFAKRVYDHTGHDARSIVWYLAFCWIVGILAAANPPAFLYQGFQPLMSSETEAALKEAAGIRMPLWTSYRAVNVSFYGVYFGGVLILGWIVRRFVKTLKKAPPSQRSSIKFVITLLICLALRTLGKFAYAILFVLQARTKSPTTQLIHTIFYDLLSVLIYLPIMMLARSKSFTDTTSNSIIYIEYHPASQSSHDDQSRKYHKSAPYVRETSYDLQNQPQYQQNGDYNYSSRPGQH